MTPITNSMIAKCLAIKEIYNEAYDRAEKKWEAREQRLHGNDIMAYDYSMCPDECDEIHLIFERCVSAIIALVGCGKGAATSFMDGNPESIFGGYKVWNDNGWCSYYKYDELEHAVKQYVALLNEGGSTHIARVGMDFPALGSDKYITMHYGVLYMKSTKWGFSETLIRDGSGTEEREFRITGIA